MCANKIFRSWHKKKLHSLFPQSSFEVHDYPFQQPDRYLDLLLKDAALNTRKNTGEGATLMEGSPGPIIHGCPDPPADKAPVAHLPLESNPSSSKA